MKYLGKEVIAKLKIKYPIGKRVVLVYMDDEKSPPVGTLGTVIGVDDIGSIKIAWDTGSRLSALYGVDRVETIK